MTWLGAVLGVGAELAPWLLELELLELEPLELELLELELPELELPELELPELESSPLPSSPVPEEAERPLSPAGDEDPELPADEDVGVPDAEAEWVEPGRMKATAPAVASPVRPMAVVAARTRARPRCRATAADSKSGLR